MKHLKYLLLGLFWISVFLVASILILLVVVFSAIAITYLFTHFWVAILSIFGLVFSYFLGKLFTGDGTKKDTKKIDELEEILNSKEAIEWYI